MKFIVDAHLPKSICSLFTAIGHEAIHTSDLSKGNETDDRDITSLAVKEKAVLVSKDSDFYHSFLLQRQPPKLVLVKTGNLRLADVKALFSRELEKIINFLGNYDMIELHSDKIIVID